MSKDNGGPAFPFGQTDELSGQLVNGWGSEGMTLRDYFAAKALGALLGSSKPGGWHVGPTGNDNEWLAAASYGLADAMLAERAK